MPARNQFKSMEENVESTLGGSLQTFMSHIMGPEKFGVSTSQLFHFQMTYPPCLSGSAGSGGEHSGLFKDKYIDHMRLFSLYASEVNTPTKQITTAGYRAIGSEINYATGSTFSEMSVRFLIPRSYISVLPSTGDVYGMKNSSLPHSRTDGVMSHHFMNLYSQEDL